MIVTMMKTGMMTKKRGNGMENYIVINGRKAELTEEQLKALGLEREIKSPFSRVNDCEYYYVVGFDGKVGRTREMRMNMDNRCFEVANYCTDREIMEQRALHETLNRLLWRYSMEHNGNEIDWNDINQAKWCVFFNHKHNGFEPFEDKSFEHWGSVYFLTNSIARHAIREVIKPFMAEHPDFKF